MKKLIYILICSISLIGCTDFLERDPKTALSPASFWNTENDLKLALNSLYNSMNHDVDADVRTADCFGAVGNTVSSGTFSASNTDGVWTNCYLQIRTVNTFLENYQKAAVTDAVKNQYLGEALFFKAYYYFSLIVRFGDVPYITKTLDLDSPELYGARESVAVILDAILADLATAEQHLPLKGSGVETGRITKGAAQALMARIALHYGTYYKFRGVNGYEKYLTLAKEASKRVIDSKKYALYDDYRNLFLYPGEDSEEHILSYRFSEEADTYNWRIRATIVDFNLEPTKILADAFLCKDGLPIDKSAYTVEYLPLGKEFNNRDPRMALTIWKPGDDYLGSPFLPNLSNQTRTGYMFKKYGDENSLANMKSTIDEILIRYAEVLLIYAEASYELNGAISDEELNISINALRSRFAGHANKLPDLTNAFVTAHGLNMRDEIRRERRVELAAEGFRYEDLIRWKTAETELPNSILGAKFDPVAYPKMTPGKDVLLDANGFILVQNGSTRSFDPQKHYLYPLPLREISLNAKLSQNPGW